MKTIKKLAKLMTGIATCVTMTATAAPASDIGARLYVQGWNPQQPDDPMISRPFEQTNAISSAINLGWTAARATICDSIKDKLGAANAGGKGITFYQINCDMARSGNVNLIPAAIEYDKQQAKWVTVPRMNDGRSFVLRFIAPGNYLDIHSTTPSLDNGQTIAAWGSGGALMGAPGGLGGFIIGGIAGLLGGLFDSEAGLGDWADPQFKINYDITLDVGFNTIGGLNINRVVSTVSNVTVNPANAPASIFKMAVDFANSIFKTPAFDTLVSKGIEGRQLDFSKTVAASLSSVNSTIAPYINPVGNYVQLGVWGKNNMITFAFYPRMPLPLPPTTAIVTGKIRMKKNRLFNLNTCPPNISLTSQVMIGPKPIIGVDPLRFGPNPVGNFGRFHYTGAGSATSDSFDCPYALDNLPVGMMNVVLNSTTDKTGGLPIFAGLDRAAGSGAVGGSVLKLSPAGWDPRLIPAPILTGKDWDAQIVPNPNSGSVAKYRIKPEIDVGDPLHNRITDPMVNQTLPNLSATMPKPGALKQKILPSTGALPQRSTKSTSAVNRVETNPAIDAPVASVVKQQAIVLR